MPNSPALLLAAQCGQIFRLLSIGLIFPGWWVFLMNGLIWFWQACIPTGNHPIESAISWWVCLCGSKVCHEQRTCVSLEFSFFLLHKVSHTWEGFPIAVSLLLLFLSKCIQFDDFAIEIKTFWDFDDLLLFKQLINLEQTLLRLDNFPFKSLHTQSDLNLTNLGEKMTDVSPEGDIHALIKGNFGFALNLCNDGAITVNDIIDQHVRIKLQLLFCCGGCTLFAFCSFEFWYVKDVFHFAFLYWVYALENYRSDSLAWFLWAHLLKKVLYFPCLLTVLLWRQHIIAHNLFPYNYKIKKPKRLWLLFIFSRLMIRI